MKTFLIRSDRLTVVLLGVLIAAGCSSTSAPQIGTEPAVAKADPTGVTSRLSIEDVRRLATARIEANGFPVYLDSQWHFSLTVKESGPHLWHVHCLPAGAILSPFFVVVDDATGEADFVMPVLQGEQQFAPNSDWLLRVFDGLQQASFPVELETLMKQAHFGETPESMGGRTKDGRYFSEFDIRNEEHPPARFVVRCYFDDRPQPFQPRLVTAAEVLYWDARVYSYRLVPDPI